MGPIIGMSPDKKAESLGVLGERAGLRGVCGTIPEAECASSPLATSLDRTSSSGDEELTNLNWLHENLLQNFTLGEPEAQSSPSPLFDIEGNHGNSVISSATSRGDSIKSKPPFSFSLLIYMAIEQSPSKSLPVKDIYGWILEHFPYFSSAPTGWKNSVRHNLSLNKCFRKVERSLGKVNGKGSLWCVDPEYRPNLIQALKKQHFPTAHSFCTPPASPPSAFSPARHLFLQGCSLKESDIDAATAMMLLNSAPGHHSDPSDPDSPINLSRPDSVLVSSDPKQDHNYSSASFQRCSSRSSSSSSSSLCSMDDTGCDSGQGRRAGSEGFHSDEDSEEERNLRLLKLPICRPLTVKCSIPGKRTRHESKPELDEELKEAAGSLLHLAGIRSGLDLSKRMAKSKKQAKHRK
ncbi:forkhead box protein N2-like [Myxocyprinus asiaticus]|uniref:forkhead box protein N2-like n=1 Tax=Myxocyprinus asiaticus TaxID=70543 RepID=UPI002222D1F7|nr:forkhead box protein N2-like [Myxocyprinus asiaticus]XP_051508342.1 forkhead box protein N2-like [Myxocyprinus asiaticus]XP_051508343.1 forkhead box protein N2-like [Myxocyprinus asiaticus]